ncbi:unnamed protein product [Cyprideis torosa]|uniref:Receptor ligand binding region domain-containing protein n=1 Tax=Cyprideis torosa TaxID=163714 RepID=A0A7R8WHI7_9CRUS|nr:unnamed protein product [Cyprideis torosa]CAG0892960.1 unnamed protein product [Cyprideis torosa]
MQNCDCVQFAAVIVSNLLPTRTAHQDNGPTTGLGWVKTPLSMGPPVCGHFQRGIYAMIPAVNPDSFDTFHSYSNTFQVPLITPSFPEKIVSPSSRRMDFSLNVRPQYHAAILDVVQYYGWSKIIFIYDSDDEGQGGGLEKEKIDFPFETSSS